MLGNTILLTGSTGFVGMAVLERLLRDHYESTQQVYCIVRASKGESAKARLDNVFKNPIFESLHKLYPKFSDKVFAIEGDLSLLALGLCDEDFERIASITTIVHCAASIEFNLPLKEAFNINTLGVVRLLELADKCAQLEGIVHVSTAYTNCNRKGSIIQEKIYPMTIGNPLYLVENIPLVGESELISLEECVLKEYPNTYTFTKSLTEHVLQANSERWNIAIVRPSIITPALSSPFPGWTHGLAAIGGVVALVGMGVVDSMPAKPEGVVDIIPVDYVASAVVGAAIGVKEQCGLKIYHATSSELNPLTWETFRVGVLEGWGKQPALQKKLFPISLQLIPDPEAFNSRLDQIRQRKFFETAYKLAKKDPLSAGKILNLVHKLESANSNFSFFAINQWIYESSNLGQLEMAQPLSETRVCSSHISEIDWVQYMATFTYGIRRYVLEKNLPPNKADQQPLPKVQGTSYQTAPTATQAHA